MTVKNKLSKTIAAAAVLAASAIFAPAALAHGTPDPMYGGVVQTVNHVVFELVATPDGALVYTLDHDEPADASRYDGKLTVLNGADKSEAPLKHAGGNKLEAKGVKLLPGAKVVAVLNTSSKKTITVRFTAK